MTANGYGLAYAVGNEHLRWCITTTNGKAKEFKANLIWAADEVMKVMESAKAKEGESKAKL